MDSRMDTKFAWHEEGVVGGVSSCLGYLRLLALHSMQIQQQAVAVLFERTP